MAATAMTKKAPENLSPSEKKIFTMGLKQGATEIRKKVSNALGHLADPVFMAGGDLAAGTASWLTDLGGRYVTYKLAQPAPVAEGQPPPEPGFIAKNREYVSGALSMGLGATSYAVNLAMGGSKATPLRIGVRSYGTQTFFAGLDRVLVKALKLEWAR
jgi:hypothetical protein